MGGYSHGMTTDQLRKHYKAQPFQPFTLRLSDGRHIDVNHPDQVAHVQGFRSFVVGIPSERAYETVDLLHVVGIEAQDADAEAGDARRKGGKRRKK